MPQDPLASPAPTRPSQTLARRSGTLKLFLDPAPPSASGAPSDQPYARFRLCRGFLDDLNRILPIRMRIQLETEIGKGRDRGRMDAPGVGFLWEFAES